MKREILAGLFVIVLIGVLLFFEQTLEYFNGMDPLEAVKTIFTFILHVTVGTILAYVVYTLPEIVTPWMRWMKRQKRQARRWAGGPNARWRGQQIQAPKQPRLTKEMRLLLLLQQLDQKPASRNSGQQSPAAGNETPLDLKF